ncbi:MAG: hypothetical protein AB7O28_22300 [Vicinamibacterales bacterium]
MKIAVLVLSVAAVLLGGLWLTQGLGLVTIEPILCVGDCAPVVGPSTQWVAAGALAVTVGALGILYTRATRRTGHG